MSGLTFLPAVSMAEQIRKKKISPVELVEAHLAQIEKLNPKLNAFVQVDAERARRAAHDAESAVIQKGKPLGPLHGVPISIKSSVEVAGMRCEAGTRLRAGLCRDARCAAGDALEECRRDCSGCDQHSRTSDGMGNRQPALWPHATTLGISSARPAAPAVAKRRRLPRGCLPAEWAATVEVRFACRRTSAAFAV